MENNTPTEKPLFVITKVGMPAYNFVTGQITTSNIIGYTYDEAVAQSYQSVFSGYERVEFITEKLKTL